jgi:ATP-dependent Clp protease ATP-binding subunit ClpA
MFERFSRPARDVVVGAQEQARELDHRLIATPHLLLSLLSGDSGELLRAHGVTAEAVRADLADLTRQDPRVADDDAAVLAALGIDVAKIRAAIEANFGPGALDLDLTPPDDDGSLRGRLARLRRRRAALRPGLPRDEVEALRRPGRSASGHLPFSPSAKKTLELALREAIRLGNQHIGPEHLTLGLLRNSDGAAAAVLDRLGADVAGIRQDAEQRLRRSA